MKLREIYESIQHLLHHGPSCAPFFEAMVAAKEELEVKLEEQGNRLKALEDHFSARFPSYTSTPEYISPPRPINRSALVGFAAAAAISGSAPDDGASLLVDDEIPKSTAAHSDEQDTSGTTQAEASSSEAAQPSPASPDPAEPGITPDSVSLPAQPEPVSAGPDVPEAAATEVVATTDQGV